MRIVISYQSGMPIYEQIKEQIKESILSGDLPESEMLPSIRQLAKELKTSVITTTRAYNDLELEGFIHTVPGKGCYVKRVNNELIKAKYLEDTRDTLAKAVKQGKMAGLTIAELHDLLNNMEEESK